VQNLEPSSLTALLEIVIADETWQGNADRGRPLGWLGSVSKLTGQSQSAVAA
jgi:hypothetical protein